MRTRPATDAEKSGAGTRGIEQIEHLRRHFGVWPVVDGQRHGVRTARGQAGQIGAEQGRARQQAGRRQHSMVGRQHSQPARPVLRRGQQPGRRRAMYGKGGVQRGSRLPAPRHGQQP